jgi:hypothetical protein
MVSDILIRSERFDTHSTETAMTCSAALRYDRDVLKVLRYGFAALIAAFALLQLNDPDPVIWVMAYGLVAFCIAVPPHLSLWRDLSWLTGGVLLTLALLSFPGFLDYLLSRDPSSIFAEMSPDMPHIEPAREFLGLVIAGAALVGRYRLSKPSA